MASMKNVFVLLANGFEEMEAVIPIDLMRRAGISVHVVSMSDELIVTGSRGIILKADMLFSHIDNKDLVNNLPDAVFLPGGLQGAINLSEHPFTKKIITTMLENNKLVCVVCASPIIVLAPMGVLDGKKFTCYPGMEKEETFYKDADISGHCIDRVVIDGNLITSKGPGTAADCAFTLIELLIDKQTSDTVKAGALFT